AAAIHPDRHRDHRAPTGAGVSTKRPLTTTSSGLWAERPGASGTPEKLILSRLVRSPQPLVSNPQ
ncbi:MAG: hypothetical protein ACJ78G_02395, partial [Gemmatimonadaceae bacterium]